MKFVIWFLKTTAFHIAVLLIMLVISFTWEAGYDKTIALYMILTTIVVLVVGKLYYFRKYGGKPTKRSRK